jgi:hypothetical protein
VSDRLAIVSALEALEAGDTRLAVDILLGALEELDDGPASGGRRRAVCPHCRVAFRWPGLLDQHLTVVHGHELAA